MDIRYYEISFAILNQPNLFNEIMTGGVGFSSQGSDSIKHNRSLGSFRRRLRDNLHFRKPPVAAKGDLDFEAIKDWKNKKVVKERKQRIYIACFLLSLFLLFLIIFNI